MLKKAYVSYYFLLTARSCGPSYHLEVSSAELLHFPRLAIVLGDPGEERGDDLRVWHHKVLREGRAAGFAGRLPHHCFFDLSCDQCPQELDLFAELVGIEILSVGARGRR